MCGIVGYIGSNNALPVLIKGLQRLEYRGYDSAGIGIIAQGAILIRKRPGKIKDLIWALTHFPLQESTIGIAHTRWATHGAPNQTNAHPHLSNSKRIALVHNGIIENYQSLKDRLLKQGVAFSSDTDTEVVVQLIERYYRRDLKEAVRKALREVKGSYALAVVSRDEPDKIVVARQDSPLIIAKGKAGNFVASDCPAIMEYTKDVLYLKDGQIAVVTKNTIDVNNISDGKKASCRWHTLTYDIAAAEKENYQHFMLKEIFEQPGVAQKIIASRLKGQKVHFDELKIKEGLLKKTKNIVIVACGTAYHAGLVGKYIFEHLVRIPVSVDVSSEFRYRDPIIDKNTLVIAISQSGETADTLAAARLAKQRGAKIVAVCNVAGSSLVRDAHGVIHTYAGPEIGVASTKAYTAQLEILYLFGLYLTRLKGVMSSSAARKYVMAFKKIPSLQRKILADVKSIKNIADRHHNFGSFLYLGRNINFPTALEGALKLKEISYIPAEGYAAGEMKHGPIALIDEYRAVVCIATQSSVYDKMLSNIQEIRARQGTVVAVASQGDKEITQYVKEVIEVPKIDELFSPILAIIPLQLLAYYVALRRGCDVDQPRNLAKSVTVE
ncbi:glutamine--fructose-6-phosphate transaminase (isomerizing) [Candidatus Omnitrophota bacterium]